VGEREIVPIAYWRGELWAAVLELWYRPADPEPGFEPVGLDTTEQAYHWRDGRWEAAGGSGGGSWSDDLCLDAPPLEAGEVWGGGYGHYGGPEWVAGVASGVAGSDACRVEVEQDGRVESRPIDSPLRAWVVAFDGRRPAIVRVRGDRAVLLEEVVDPVDW
jgi:hypothetical protein